MIVTLSDIRSSASLVERCCSVVACFQLKDSVLRSHLPADVSELITKFDHSHSLNEPTDFIKVTHVREIGW